MYRTPQPAKPPHRVLSRHKTVDGVIRRERALRLDPATRLIALAAAPRMHNKSITVTIKGSAPDVNITLNQNMGVFLTLLASKFLELYGTTTRVPDNETVSGLMALRFMTRGAPVNDVLKGVAALRPDIDKKLHDMYTLNPSEEAIQPSSAMAPTLRWGMTHSPKLQNIIDWNERLVVKAYPVTTMLRNAMRTDLPVYDRFGKLTELVNDVVLGATFAAAMVLDRKQATTPHFVFQLDWFLGNVISAVEDTSTRTPGIKRDYKDVDLTSDLDEDEDDEEDDDNSGRSRHTGAYGLTRFRRRLDKLGVELPSFDLLFDTNRLAQYVVAERVDTTLSKVIATTPPMPLLKALLFQMLFSLEAGFETSGYLHYDAHFGNVMVRNLHNEPQSPYLNTAWLYVRPLDRSGAVTGPRHYQLSTSHHGNKFIEIIDFGRSRAYCKARVHNQTVRVLVGNPTLNSLGIYADPAHADRSWDARSIGLNLLFFYSPPQSFLGNLLWDTLKAYKHLVAMAANLPHICFALARQLQNNDLIEDNWTILGTAAFDLLQKHFPDGQFLTDVLFGENVYVDMYNVMVPLLRLHASYSDISELTLWSESITRGGYNARNDALHVSALLNLPFFDEFKLRTDQTPEPNAIRVGVVEYEDTLADPLSGLERKSAVAEAPRKRRRSIGENDDDDRDMPERRRQRIDTKSCVNCGHTALGLAVHEATGEHNGHAFCSHACMHMAVEAGFMHAMQ